MNNNWLTPIYFKDFKCKADKCRHTCCNGWKIPISLDEYNRLVGMDCSKDLHDKLEVAFEDPKDKSPEKYKYISYNWLGECPLQENGLCMIHAKLGEEKLPNICRLYPRSYKTINDSYVAVCSSSCEGVVERLYELDQLTFTEIKMDIKPQIEYSLDVDAIEEIKKYNKLLADRNTTLLDSLIEICTQINESDFIKDYNNSINPLPLALKVLQRFTNSNRYLNNIIECIDERYKDNADLYLKDTIDFENRFPNWMHFFENVLNNSMLYNNFPFVDNRFDISFAYKGLCVSYGLLRFVSIGYTANHNSKEDLIDCVSELFHLIDHSAFYYNVKVACDNPAIFLKL